MSSAPQSAMSQMSSWPIRWFPLLWWIILAAVWGVMQYLGVHGMESDKRVVATIALVNLAWLGPMVWLLVCWPPLRDLGPGKKWLVRLAVAALVVGSFSSIDVDYDGDSRWRSVRFRWASDPDEQLDTLDPVGVADDWQVTPDDYPRFLGKGYWAEVADVQLAGDWRAKPPQLIWKQPIGAGWSAFAIVGNHAVTQEQRGEDELVSCYRVDDGQVVWTHADRTRHDPATMGGGLGGVGPRATPTIQESRVYTMGATGILNCLDATTGEVIWAHNVPEEYGVAPLLWANAGSPLVVPDTNLVVVNCGQAQESVDHSLLAFDRDSGELIWQSGPQTTSYASPVYAVLAGVPQIIQVNEGTVGGYRANDGTQLWLVDQPGSSSGSASCSQPIPLADDQVLISKGYGIGARLVKISADDAGDLSAKIIWQEKVLKTKLANLVVRDGYAYGLDHTLMSCVDLKTGKRRWKKRRQPTIGHGQIMLIGDKILALSETGEGILIECNPNKYAELASMQMLGEDGITWNNPALSGPYLLVRNNLEAACYRLPLESGSVAAEERSQ